MEILLWLVPAAVATGIAMAVAGWVGRERHDATRADPGRLPGEVVGAPDEQVSAARPARAAGPDTRDRPPAPTRRTA